MSTAELIHNVRKLEIRIRKALSEGLWGAYRSAVKGRGIEFSELRDYLPGDDAMDIDWGATARFGTPYAKQFSEERELTVFLMLDISGSTEFSTTDSSKATTGAEVCAMLALTAAANNDRVGLLTFTSKCECFVPPRKGMKHALRIVRELVARKRQQRRTDLAVALGRLMRVAPKQSTVFLVSDLLDGGSFGSALAIAARRHEVFVFRLTDPAEAHFPIPGWVCIEDAETSDHAIHRNSPLELSTPTIPRQANEFTRFCRKAGAHYHHLECGSNCAEDLIVFFREFGRSRWGGDYTPTGR